MTQSVKPLVIKQSAYLRGPKDVAKLLDIMGAPTGAVGFRIDEKGCALVYTFAKPNRATTTPNKRSDSFPQILYAARDICFRDASITLLDSSQQGSVRCDSSNVVEALSFSLHLSSREIITLAA